MVDKVRVYNAGLIIYWPFLTRFFEQLALVENGGFSNLSAQNKAIYLLQYLVSNTIVYPENELVLNKILVGMSINEQATQIENLSLEETDMAKSLINGLIQNWPKVQNSSAQGIQDTFIQREGVLGFYEDYNILIIEKKGVDILLESIPWSINLIKLPWMNKALQIEWI